MKVKVHWIIDGIAEIEAENPEEAELEVENQLSKFIGEDSDLTKNLGARAIQGKAFLPGIDDKESETIDHEDS
jgi:hypothetical protein